MPSAGPIGILGGTFDPIHLGHLRMAFELAQALELAEVRFIPCSEPPHRPAPSATDLRVEMVRAAIAGEARFRLDERELEREGPSYTVETLASLRAELPTRTLCLLLGMDAFLGLPTWHRWTELVAYAHIVVAQRPGWVAPRDGPIGELLARCEVDDASHLRGSTGGSLLVTAVTQLDISSSGLRTALARGEDPRYLVPESVREIILRSGCYR